MQDFFTYSVTQRFNTFLWNTTPVFNFYKILHSPTFSPGSFLFFNTKISAVACVQSRYGSNMYLTIYESPPVWRHFQTVEIAIRKFMTSLSGLQKEIVENCRKPKKSY